MKIKVKKLYRGTEQDVYFISLLAWKSYTNYLTQFAAFNAQYTEAFATDALNAAETALAMPGSSVRQAANKIIRARLEKAAKQCRNKFQALTRYIGNSFDASVAETMKQAAGASYYRSATRDNWKELSDLNTAAIAFIEKYGADMQKDGKGMPGNFAADYSTVKTNFDTQLKQYNDAKLKIMQQTAAKTEAFNAVYKTLIEMMKDGKTIFSNDASVKHLFVYGALAKLAGKNSKAGMHIEVLDRITLLPVTTTSFVIQPGNISGFVNANGIADITMTAGNYALIATAPGYATVTFDNIVVKTGTMRRVALLLDKAVAAA